MVLLDAICPWQQASLIALWADAERIAYRRRIDNEMKHNKSEAEAEQLKSLLNRLDFKKLSDETTHDLKETLTTKLLKENDSREARHGDTPRWQTSRVLTEILGIIAILAKESPHHEELLKKLTRLVLQLPTI